MLGRLSDFSDFSSFSQARAGAPWRGSWRELDWLFGEAERSAATAGPARPFALEDRGTHFVLQADVPGVKENEIEVEVVGNVVSVRAERKFEEKAGYAAHRRERRAFSLTRKFELSSKVDADKVIASLKDGVLALTLPKVPEARPRQISVTAG